jgi:ABC-type transport system involved in multi-copper enzyme maturation permease subunit
LRSEWTKLRSVHSTWICLAIIIVAGIGLSALITNVEAGRWSSITLQERANFDPVRFSQTGVFISQFVVGVLGALVITAEYSTGLIRTTLTALPRRSSVLAAKSVVLALCIAVVGELTAFASFFVSEAVLVAHGARSLPQGSSIYRQALATHIPVASITAPGVLRAVALGGLFLVLLSLLALGIGFVIRSTAGAISLFVGFLLIIPLIIQILPSSLSSGIERYLPSNLGVAMVVTTTHKTDFAGTLLSPWFAMGMLALYAAVVLGFAAWLLQRRDA